MITGSGSSKNFTGSFARNASKTASRSDHGRVQNSGSDRSTPSSKLMVADHT